MMTTFSAICSFEKAPHRMIGEQQKNQNGIQRENIYCIG